MSQASTCCDKQCCKKGFKKCSSNPGRKHKQSHSMCLVPFEPEHIHRSREYCDVLTYGTGCRYNTTYREPWRMNRCHYRQCSRCPFWHCSCTPCYGVGYGRDYYSHSHRDRQFRLNRSHASSDLACRTDVWERPPFHRFSYRDVTYEVPEDRLDIQERHMHDDVHHGSSMNMVKAYIGYHEDKVAIKWYRGSFDRGEEYCKKVVREAKESARVVRAFMNEVDTRGWTVRVAIPRITEVYSEGHDAERTVLVEPYLSHFESFYETADDIAYGSNRAYHRVIHALLHFSIWHTRGRGILADLKGSVDREMKEIILSAPSVIHHAEREHRHSGTGIFSFLSEHVCSRMCKETIRYRSHLRFSDDTSLW